MARKAPYVAGVAFTRTIDLIVGEYSRSEILMSFGDPAARERWFGRDESLERGGGRTRPCSYERPRRFHAFTSSAILLAEFRKYRANNVSDGQRLR
jgi:hypothetical protein